MNAYQTFIQTAAMQYKRHPSVMAKKICLLLSTIKITSLSHKKSSFLIDSHAQLPDIIDSKSHPLFESLKDCYESLIWRPSGFGKLPPEITNHVAVVEIIGPTGMIKDSRFRFGLLLQDPQILYSKHQHAAEELYLILNGSAAWSVDDNESTIHGVDEFIHHAKNQPHQMKTNNNEPLLTIWAWLGDIDSESYSI